MEKSDFINELTVQDIVTLDNESTVFETKKWTFKLLVPEWVLEKHDTLWSAITSHQQHRMDGNKNPIETCFIIYYETMKQLKSITVKILDHKGNTGIFWFSGYDSKWPFTYDIVFPYYLSIDFIQQLIHLYNQDKLYFHIYREGGIYKTIVQDNPFKNNKEIEIVLLSIDMSAIENALDPLPEIYKRLQDYKKDLSLEAVTSLMKNTSEYFISSK